MTDRARGKDKTMNYSRKRMLIAGTLVLAYLLTLTFYGSPLLAFTTWMGWVDPQAAR
ncbi:hypothetical protein FHW37_102508 [Neorhizobium alkalisoli]|uniref:Uncharacterized protein n=1 Tax=Neorhizobium alkalisoli TaxID=528178 RepID=A0A561R2N3_9HYPH|nr:hypothetical protein FHW37_102508 [Neorhizobium alkalisoli]